MKEQLISFETAKLAKDKGFNWNTDYFYRENNMLCFSQYYDSTPNNRDIEKNFFSDTNEQSNLLCTAPTQSLLQKWLRDVHEIHIELNVHSASKPEKFTYSVSILPKSYGTWIRIGEFLTYEEALEKGLFEALKLIK